MYEDKDVKFELQKNEKSMANLNTNIKSLDHLKKLMNA